MRQHAPAEQDGDLGSVALVGLGLAAVKGLQVPRMAQDEGALFLLGEIGEPVAGEHTLPGKGEAVAEGGEGLEEGVGASGDGLLLEDGSASVEDAEGEGWGVQIDAAGESVLLVGESPHGFRGMG